MSSERSDMTGPLLGTGPAAKQITYRHSDCYRWGYFCIIREIETVRDAIPVGRFPSVSPANHGWAYLYLISKYCTSTKP